MEELIHTTSGELKPANPYAVGTKHEYRSDVRALHEVTIARPPKDMRISDIEVWAVFTDVNVWGRAGYILPKSRLRECKN